MSRRKICIVTGSRAEYGLFYCLMKEIEKCADLELKLVVTGMHLSPEFGLTYRQIQEDGFVINEKVEMLLSSDSYESVAKSVGLGIIGFADAFKHLDPDIIVLLGDRFEIFAAAQAAMFKRIPIAHIHGGELTEGAIDDSIRHAITKMSHIHFVSTHLYKKRVIQLGEQPDHVFVVGAPGLDLIKQIKLLSKSELEKQLDFRFGTLNFLVTYHPATLEDENDNSVIELFKALDYYPQAKVIITKANADAGGRKINKLIDKYALTNKNRVKVVTSLGQLKYFSAINIVDAVIGNSSSGLIEVPFFKKPTINIGSRQKGRLSADSVINCDDKEDIIKAIQTIQSYDFQKKLLSTKSIYGDGYASIRIVEVLRDMNITNIVKKGFFDLDHDLNIN